MRDKDLLDQAIRDWRREPEDEALSGAARTRILAALDSSPKTRRFRFASLFLPSRLAWGAAVPAVVLTLVLGLQLLPRDSRLTSNPHVAAMKDGDDVVFVIANGDRVHRVYRSEDGSLTDPAAEPFAVTDGIFRDRLDSEAKLIFYRID